MEFQITNEIITVKPKSTYLSASELIAQRQAKYEVFSAGVRKVYPQNTEEENQELAKMYDQLEKQLSRPRIDRVDGRAVGCWDDECQAVRILRKDGKFDQIGYSCNGRHYLTYYEALFLLELNRLQLEYKSLDVSVEQAYLLFLGEQKSHKFNVYLVYSHLSRAGYLLRKYQNIQFNKAGKLTTLEDCIWATLKAKLKNSETPETVRKSSYYNNIQQQFEVNTKAIRDAPQPSITNSNDPQVQTEEHKDFTYQLKATSKRSASAACCSDIRDNWQNAKRGCWSPLCVGTDTGLTDVLRDDPVYQKFKDTFAEFDIIRLTRYESESDEDENSDPVFSSDDKLDIDFDLYLRCEAFSKTEMRPPNFRVVILKGNTFPTHRDVYELYRQQVHPVPLLIVTVSEWKQLQAYSYHFS